MTSKERVLMSIDHKLPDRMPVDFLWVRSETIRELKNHFKTDSQETVMQKLGVDIRWTGVSLKFPEFEKKCNGELTGDAPGAGKRYIFLDKDTFADEWGIVHKVGSDGKYLEWRDGPLVGKETLDGWEPPVTEYPSVEETRKKFLAVKEYAVFGGIDMPFKIAWHICGYEHFLTMMALNPDFIHALYDKIYAWQTRRALHMVEAGADVICVVGDIAGKNGMMFSIPMFEEFDVPRFTRLIKDIKAKNPKCKVFYHSDGQMESAIPSLVKCGLDILNPIESNCMDPAEIKRKYGERLTLHGAISVQQTIPNGTVADVKNEVYTRIKTVGYNGGYIVSNENSFPYDAPLANVLAMYEAVQDFNYAALR